jgi:hypothetical protein
MNEKLKQLAEQAGMVHGGYANGTKIMTWRESFDNPGSLEKLFELMVFECVNAVMDGTKEGDHYAQRIEQHFDNGPGGILHFGVE